MTFHRLFVCRQCSRIVAGCWCVGCERTEELVDYCAICARKPPKETNR